MFNLARFVVCYELLCLIQAACAGEEGALICDSFVSLWTGVPSWPMSVGKSSETVIIMFIHVPSSVPVSLFPLVPAFHAIFSFPVNSQSCHEAITVVKRYPPKLTLDPSIQLHASLYPSTCSDRTERPEGPSIQVKRLTWRAT